MPQPIIPLHHNDQHTDWVLDSNLFDNLSGLQQNILQSNKTTVASSNLKKKFADLLYQISQSEDASMTGASKEITGMTDVLYRVPKNIHNTDIIGLKTHGLIQGGTEHVKITDAGFALLREKGLNAENKFRSAKTKPKFNFMDELKHKYRIAHAEDRAMNYELNKVSGEVLNNILHNTFASVCEKYASSDDDLDQLKAYFQYLANPSQGCPDIDSTLKVASATLVKLNIRKAL